MLFKQATFSTFISRIYHLLCRFIFIGLDLLREKVKTRTHWKTFRIFRHRLIFGGKILFGVYSLWYFIICFSSHIYFLLLVMDEDFPSLVRFCERPRIDLNSFSRCRKAQQLHGAAKNARMLLYSRWPICVVVVVKIDMSICTWSAHVITCPLGLPACLPYIALSGTITCRLTDRLQITENVFLLHRRITNVAE